MTALPLKDAPGGNPERLRASLKYNPAEVMYSCEQDLGDYVELLASKRAHGQAITEGDHARYHELLGDFERSRADYRRWMAHPLVDKHSTGNCPCEICQRRTRKDVCP